MMGSHWACRSELRRDIERAYQMGRLMEHHWELPMETLMECRWELERDYQMDNRKVRLTEHRWELEREIERANPMELEMG